MADGPPAPPGDGLLRWLVGGLVAGALLLAVVLGAYALGTRNAGGSAPAAQAVPTTTAPSGAGTAPAAPAPADPAAGKVVFAQSCTGCHAQDGTADGGVGPKLHGLGLTAARIAAQVRDGGPTMPGGLVEGDDLRDVVAYTLSIQR
jgi:mono/diheme cytochrome c family protein